MKKIISLFGILIIAMSACGGSGGSTVQHPLGYAGPDTSLQPSQQTPSIYAETHYVYDFQGENYLLSCNSSAPDSGQLEIYKETNGAFTSTEKMLVGPTFGCSGVTAIVDSTNSVFQATKNGILHIAATTKVGNAIDYFVTYWCWDGDWHTGQNIETNSAESACADYFNFANNSGTPSMTIDQSTNTLWLAYQINFLDNDPLSTSTELGITSYPLANISNAVYDENDWANPIEIPSDQNFMARGNRPVIQTGASNILVMSRSTNVGGVYRQLQLWRCQKANDCSQNQNWVSNTVALNITDSYDFKINPSTGYLTLVYQSDSDMSNLHPNGIVHKEWPESTIWTSGPEKLVAMAYDPVSLAAAKISLGIEPSGRKHVFWWEHQAPFDFVLNHRFAKGNLWGGDIVTGWDGSSLTDIPINMNPVFDNVISSHGDRGFHVGYSKLNNGVQEFAVSTRDPQY